MSPLIIAAFLAFLIIEVLKMQHSQTLGIDFGTSNSAVGFMCGGTPRLVELSPGQTTLPTAFFFDFETRKTLIGQAANDALVDGLEGRYMRALKRVLGKPIMHEKRRILNETVTFVDIIARLLAQIKEHAEAASGQQFSRVLSGRPVHFHDGDSALDQRAEDDLRLCYEAAGFAEISFMAEPVAAAISVRRPLPRSSLGLVVDIGGGTSDFTVFETANEGGVNVIASHGIRIGGTDFDKAISIDHVMPLLGKGTQLKNHLGQGRLVAPNTIFNELSTWEKIPFIYSSETTALVNDMHKYAVEPAKFKRLVTTLQYQLGHDIAFAVEQGKMDANSASQEAAIDLGVVEAGLASCLSANAMNASIVNDVAAIKACAIETLQMAGVTKGQISRIVFVGGSSLTLAVSDALKQAFPDAEYVFEEVFTAVANGLTIAAE